MRLLKLKYSQDYLLKISLVDSVSQQLLDFFEQLPEVEKQQVAADLHI